jgi:hypothetical protein
MKAKALAGRSTRKATENRAIGCQASGRYVANRKAFLRSFRSLSSFIISLGLPFVTAGCGGGRGGGSLPGPGASPSIYLTQVIPALGSTQTSNILLFPSTANGTVSPTSTLTGPDGVVFSGLTVDGTGNAYVGGEIFGTGGGSGGPPLLSAEILVYAPGSSGTHPTRTITSSSLQGNGGGINALAVDNSGNLYVSAVLANVGNGVAIFPPAAGSNAVPTRTIGGSATAIVGLRTIPIAVDSADNIYISSADPLAPNSILIFNSTAIGNVSPTSTIGGPTTTINAIQGLAVDSAGNIYVSNVSSDQNATPDILEFSAGSTGDVAPTRIISGAATTMGSIRDLALDSAGNIYVISDASLLKFAANAAGNVAPIAMITPTGSLVFDYDIAVH